MKIKKRNKRSRLRGLRRCGYGFGKKHRGKGNKGGVGMSGTGKKSGQKVTLIHAKMPDYFGRKGFTSIKKIKRKNEKRINITQIENSIYTLIEDGLAKKTPEGIELNLYDYKVLGEGETKNKFIVKAKSISAGAKEKIEKAGGKVLVEEDKLTEVKEEKKAETKVKEK
jgi:large subunit ribosomal protein L15